MEESDEAVTQRLKSQKDNADVYVVFGVRQPVFRNSKGIIKALK